MDPLHIFYDIHELITQHLDYKDIFTAYRVSKSWCDLILENSKFAMEKMKLNVKESNHDEVINVLTQKTSEINSDLLNLLDSKRKYQNIKIYVDHGWDFIDQLVRNLSSCLVDVEVSSDIFVENLKIPCLKYLKLDNPLLEGLTTCSSNLRKLSVNLSGKEYWLKKESPIAIRSALKKNSHLETLAIGNDLTELIFENDLSGLKHFKLKSLHLELSKNNLDENIFVHIRKFLDLQKDLTSLSINYPDPYTMEWIYGHLNKLECLKTNIHFDYNPTSFTLPINETIKCLDMDITSNFQYTMSIKYALRTFITSSPSLEVLKIGMAAPLEIDDFRFVLFNALKLRQLHQNVHESDQTYQEIYEQIKQDHDNISLNVEFMKI